jgi:hypothetical protein
MKKILKIKPIKIGQKQLINSKMKKIFLFFIAVFAFSSCEEEGFYTKNVTNETDLSNLIVLKSGNFNPTSGISVTGSAELVTDNTTNFIRLQNFTISGGPDLKVYLSKNDFPSEFVNLGALIGSKTIYEIPASVNINEYSHVLIHCQQYNHLFAIAQLN